MGGHLAVFFIPVAGQGFTNVSCVHVGCATGEAEPQHKAFGGLVV